jgi:hypothetical protein
VAEVGVDESQNKGSLAGLRVMVIDDSKTIRGLPKRC